MDELVEDPEDSTNVVVPDDARGVMPRVGGHNPGVDLQVAPRPDVDPATLPPPVPESITPRQCRLILAQQNLLDSVEAMIAQQDRATQITWEYALEFRRDDPLLNALAGPDKLNLSKEQIDQFFIASAQL